MTANNFNPFYVAWCNATGQTAGDHTLPIYKFSLWIHAKWRDFDALNGRTKPHHRTDDEISEFTHWLTTTSEVAS